MTTLQVDLRELRGYADALDDVARDLGGIEALVDKHCVDTDFGKIVESMTADYAVLLPQVKEVLDENEKRLRAYAVAADRTASDFASTDDGIASRFKGDGINATSGVSAFELTPVGSRSPSASEGELPEVSFGPVFDKLAWALDTITGWDVRAEVTDWIAGDTVGLSLQADTWEVAADRLSTTAANLGSSGQRIHRTWTGEAAAADLGSMVGWHFALTDQETALRKLGTTLKDLAKEAVNVAQLVVDCIRLAIDLVASGWALQYIPVVGQVKFAKKVWDAYKRAKKAVAYLQMIKAALRFTKSLIVVMIDTFTVESLPARPASA